MLNTTDIRGCDCSAELRGCSVGRGAGRIVALRDGKLGGKQRYTQRMLCVISLTQEASRGLQNDNLTLYREDGLGADNRHLRDHSEHRRGRQDLHELEDDVEVLGIRDVTKDGIRAPIVSLLFTS